MTILHATAESETRTLTRIGIITVVGVVVAAAILFAVNSLGGKPHDVISLTIDTPYVGQGVASGTPVILRGVKIGQVTSVSSIPGGGVRLETDLQSKPTRGLTDAMQIDFRPSNYFGVTGIAVTPASAGSPLRNGLQLKMIPKGNFSLQALIYRLGELSNGVFNQRLVSVIQRATQYVDAFDPLLETALMVGTSVSKVQRVSTERLLRNTTGVSVAFPGFINTLIGTGDSFLHSEMGTRPGDFDPEKFKQTYKYWSVLDDTTHKQFDDLAKLALTTEPTDEYYDKRWIPLFDKARTAFLGVVGKLESSHLNDLFPVVESVRALADTVPKIVSPDDFASTLTEIRTRFERIYSASGDEHALNVRIIMDRLPGVGTPLGLLMSGSS
ncbi:MAG: MlaD family protein [Mycobacterium sp.]|uniref:MlaD family protein n=1 Tax=Mycobacterium sp. TaxID=1785 RepID=UPI003C429522